MKKIMFLFILAVAACMNVSGQSKVDRFINRVDRTIHNIDRFEKSMQRLGRAVGIKDRRGRCVEKYDYKTAITSEYRYKKLSMVRCDNVWLEVYDDRVSVYFATPNGWVLEEIIYRNQFGEFIITDAVCGPRRDVTIRIENSRQRTAIRFWHRNVLIKGFYEKTYFKSPWK